jgi:hypothetical protein
VLRMPYDIIRSQAFESTLNTKTVRDMKQTHFPI